MKFELTLKNWYTNNTQLSLELIYGFTQINEEQIKEINILFNKNKENIIVWENIEEYMSITSCFGLDDTTWNLQGLFESHFPNLQRRSILITLYSFFEIELNSLCKLYKSKKAFKLDISDLSGNWIIDKSINYLEKVANINVHKESEARKNIKKIQKIRNLIVHQDWIFVDKQWNINDKDILNYIKQLPWLEWNKEIIIKHEFLKFFLDNIQVYFKLLDKSINESEK